MKFADAVSTLFPSWYVPVAVAPLTFVVICRPRFARALLLLTPVALRAGLSLFLVRNFSAALRAAPSLFLVRNFLGSAAHGDRMLR